jgi:uncharacterized protein (TIGR00369 family)
MVTPDEHCRRLERLYLSAPINRIYEPDIRVSERTAEVALTVQPAFHHAAHALHGSVYFKCLDDAAFFAANSVIFDVFVLTVTFNIVLLRPVTAGRIVATGRLVHTSRSLQLAEAELRDERQRLVASGSGTFMRSTIALGPEVGYVGQDPGDRE